MPVPAWRYRRPRIRPCRSGRKYLQLSAGTGTSTTLDSMRAPSTDCSALSMRSWPPNRPTFAALAKWLLVRGTVEAVTSTGLPTAASLRQHFSPDSGLHLPSSRRVPGLKNRTNTRCYLGDRGCVPSTSALCSRSAVSTSGCRAASTSAYRNDSPNRTRA